MAVEGCGESGGSGVVSQAVKDVVQSLVDDDLVHVDKIGTSNWYWAFPGEATNNARSALANAEATKEALEGEKNALTKEVNKEKKKNPVTDKHERTSAALASAKESNAALKDELETFRVQIRRRWRRRARVPKFQSAPPTCGRITSS